MDQRTNNWLEWRKLGIGGSDAPIIMGASPWKTPLGLFEEKISKEIKEQVSNFAQERGNYLEPIARAKYELEVGFEMPPATCQHYQFDYLRASMDGWNPKAPPFGTFDREHKRGFEVKYVGKEDHENALKGIVPEKYIWQLVHQFIVTGADVIDYYSYFCPKGTKSQDGIGVRIEVFPDPALIAKYVPMAHKFWDCVTKKKPPALCDDDYKLIRSVSVKKLAEDWKRKKLAAKIAADELAEADDALKSAIGDEHPRYRVEGTLVKMITVTKAGLVNYKSIPELKGVDLDKYRGKEIVYKQLGIESEESEEAKD